MPDNIAKAAVILKARKTWRVDSSVAGDVAPMVLIGPPR